MQPKGSCRKETADTLPRNVPWVKGYKGDVQICFLDSTLKATELAISCHKARICAMIFFGQRPQEARCHACLLARRNSGSPFLLEGGHDALAHPSAVLRLRCPISEPQHARSGRSTQVRSAWRSDKLWLAFQTWTCRPAPTGHGWRSLAGGLRRRKAQVSCLICFDQTCGCAGGRLVPGRKKGCSEFLEPSHEPRSHFFSGLEVVWVTMGRRLASQSFA